MTVPRYTRENTRFRKWQRAEILAHCPCTKIRQCHKNLFKYLKGNGRNSSSRPTGTRVADASRVTAPKLSKVKQTRGALASRKAHGVFLTATIRLFATMTVFIAVFSMYPGGTRSARREYAACASVGCVWEKGKW